MTEKLASLKVDDALAAGTDIGPVVDQSQLDQDLAYIEIGKAEGATLAVGGERVAARDRGLLPVAGAVHRARRTRCASRARRSSARSRA